MSKCRYDLSEDCNSRDCLDCVLDKIRADVEQYQADCDLSCSDDANCKICDKITFDTIYRIIDKYRKGIRNDTHIQL